MYGIITWGSAFKSYLEPLNITHRILTWILTKNYNNKNQNTEHLFKNLKILTIESLYDKLSIMNIHYDQNKFEIQWQYVSRSLNNRNLKFIKHKTTLMSYYFYK